MIESNRMTAGSPAKHILKFAFPLMFGNVFQQLYTIVDTAVVGKALGVNALAALGTTEWMIFFVVGAIQGITHGFSVIVAQRFGNKEEEGVRAAALCASVLTLIFAVIFVAAGLCLISPVLKIIRVPEEIYGMAKEYLRIIYGGIPITFVYHMMAAVLRAVGNSKVPLKAIAISSVCNIFLDIYFVIYMRQGIVGAAWATIMAQMISVFYIIGFGCQVLEKPGCRKGGWRKKGKLGRRFFGDIRKKDLLEELRMGLPLGVQNMVTALGGLAVQAMINSFGVLFIAGYTAAVKLYGLLEIPASSYGYAMSVFAGQNVGAGEKARVKRGLFSGIVIGTVSALVMSAIMIGAGDKIVACFISAGNEPGAVAAVGALAADSVESVVQTIKIAYDFLVLLAIFFPMLYILYIARGCVQGLGNSLLPVVSSFMQLLMRIGGAYVLAGIIGEYGVFWGEILAWAGADAILACGVFLWFKKKSGNGLDSQSKGA